MSLAEGHGSCHVCLIFYGDDQRREVVSEFLTAGLRNGERVGYFADVTPPDTIRDWVTFGGIEVPRAEARGAFGIVEAAAAYCANGRHDPAVAIAAAKAGYAAAQRGGFTASRSCGEMSWVLKGLPGAKRFLEYEALLNQVNTPFPHSGMCQYDARLFDGAMLFKVLQVHPYMIAGGQIVQNPYYEAPRPEHRL